MAAKHLIGTPWCGEPASCPIIARYGDLGEDSRMRPSVASSLRPLQCQPPIVLRPGPAPCSAVARTGRNLPWHCWREYPPRHEHTTTISGWPANDHRQHARQRRAVARRVLLAVPPRSGVERRCGTAPHGSSATLDRKPDWSRRSRNLPCHPFWGNALSQ
jgi:hypothetical protein